MRTLLIIMALIAVAATPLAAASPPCTCDPNPITDLVQCLVNGHTTSGNDCPTDDILSPGPSVPPLPNVKDLDPRNWPCTCDPPPQLF